MNWKQYVLFVSVIVFASCGTRPCREGTLFVRLKHNYITAMADNIELVVIAGKTTQQLRFQHPLRMNQDTVQVDFKPGYPMGHSVTVNGRVSRADKTIGFGSKTVQLQEDCHAIELEMADANAPIVTKTHPEPGAPLGATESLEFTFSTKLDVSTVNEKTVSVSRDGALVKGEVSLNGDIVRWKPFASLPRGVYTTTLLDVRDLQGIGIDRPYTWDFEVGGWSAPQLLEQSSSSARSAVLAVDADQRIWAAWTQKSASGNTELFARRYVNGAWEGTKLVDESTRGFGTPQILGAKPGGPVWLIYDSDPGASSSQILASKWDGSRWIKMGRIVNVPSPAWAVRPSAGMDQMGNMFISYLLNDSMANRVDVNVVRYTPAGGWESPVELENTTDKAISTQLAVSANGTATATWLATTTGVGHIWAKRYVPENGWMTSAQQLDGASGGVGVPSVATDEFGNGMIVWQQVTGSTFNTLESHWNGSNFSQEYTIASDTDGWFTFRMNAKGQAIVGNLRFVGGTYVPSANLYSRETNWHETKFEANPTLEIFGVDLDEKGNAMFVISQIGPPNALVANYKPFKQPWEPSKRLSAYSTDIPHSPIVAMTSSGLTIATWFQVNPSSDYDLFYSISP